MKRHRTPHSGRMNVITSGISTTLVLLLLGLAVFSFTFTRNLLRDVRENLPVEVMLNEKADSFTLMRLEARLGGLPYERNVHYISADDVAREMSEALDGSPIDFLGSNPFPAEYELYIEADYANPDSLAKYLAQLETWPGVASIEYPKDTLADVDRAVRLTNIVLLVLALLMMVISFSLINTTMLMSVYAKRQIIHTMKLVGARWSFIRRPFMLRAFWIGFVSALLADGVLAAGMMVLRQQEVYLAQLLTPEVIITTLGAVVVCGLLLTLLGAYFSVNRHLRLNGGAALLA